MATYYLRNTTESPNALKQLLATVLPLSLKRHLLYLKHYRRLGNFRSPTRFSEKVQWRIINDRREVLRDTCDKRASKKRALATAIQNGVDLKVPTQLAWAQTVEEMLDELKGLQRRGALPTRWVMKPNHSSGRALAVEGVPDWSLIEDAARAWMKPSRFEGLHWIWPYTTAEAGLTAEEFIPGLEPPIEWQLWMFHGSVRYVVAQQRIGSQPFRCIFDAVWNPVEPWYNREAEPLDLQAPPTSWGKIERAARLLGEPWDMIRVDLSEDTNGAVWFSELTPFPSEGLFGHSKGLGRFDDEAGAAWVLPGT